MLILKSRDGKLYAARGEGALVRVQPVPDDPRAPRTYLTAESSPDMPAWREGANHIQPGTIFDIVEALEPEGETGALTRAVLDYRDALKIQTARLQEFLRGERADHPGVAVGRELAAIANRMITLAEAIADRAEVDGLEAHP